ncbi:MAG TPA: NAD(P)H-binding protein, partial [Candidatus Limnocylindrales bacterium]|nr:NAD(P)H-binding protein [Candidatus Limnocylindrales bacterium]
MRVLIFGATGNIGRHVREEALGAGHDLVLFARDPAKLDPLEDGEQSVAGDVADADAVRDAIDGIEAVISVLGPRSNSPEQEEVFVAFASALVAAMQARGVARLVTLSGAAVRVPGENKRPLDRLASLVLGKAVRHVVQAKQRELDIIAASRLDWIAPRPPRVVDGPLTGEYRVGDHSVGPRSRISTPDLAEFIVACLTDDEHL